MTVVLPNMMASIVPMCKRSLKYTQAQRWQHRFMKRCQKLLFPFCAKDTHT